MFVSVHDSSKVTAVKGDKWWCNMEQQLAAEKRGKVDEIVERVGEASFTDWLAEQRAKENLREGQPWLNKPPRITDARRVSPSQLLQCHRKIYYRQLNAPEETEDSDGIFWIGSKFEEELVQPFLESIVEEADSELYVRNSAWVDFEVETEAGAVRVKGETDPVVCSRTGEPYLLTEVKSKSSLDGFDDEDPEPDVHHKAQAHAYMHGLNESVEWSVDRALIIYGDREGFELLPILIEFDEEFWEETVVEWAEEHATYRIEEELPPADPWFDWECNFCSYRARCGKERSEYEDWGPRGFLPLFHYPQEKVKEYLSAYSDNGAALTPTLAFQYPELAEESLVDNWRCPVCGKSVDWREVEWEGRLSCPPTCPWCRRSKQAPVRLRGSSSEHYRVRKDEI